MTLQELTRKFRHSSSQVTLRDAEWITILFGLQTLRDLYARRVIGEKECERGMMFHELSRLGKSILDQTNITWELFQQILDGLSIENLLNEALRSHDKKSEEDLEN